MSACLPFCTIIYNQIDQFAGTLFSIMPLEVSPPSQLRRSSLLCIFLKHSLANIITATVHLFGVEDMSGHDIKNFISLPFSF
jgi:hypothetical protein